MFNRCVECGTVCPDFSDLCDCCAFIEEEEYRDEEVEEVENE